MQLIDCKIIRTDAELACPELDKALVEAGANLILLPQSITEAALAEEAQDATLILMCYTPVTQRVINAAQRLKGIVKYGVGIDAIDIQAASARGIPVVNVPRYAEQTVAEGAFCLLIALCKKLLPLDRAMKSQQWVWPKPDWLAMDIAGKTLALVGVGHIGRNMARMAGQGFGARVIGFDPHISDASLRDAGVIPCSNLHTLLAQADFVSLHCVLTPQTHQIIGQTELDLMKSEALLINVSRGALVDEHALLQALQNSKIAGAALDVYSQEPLNRTDHPLRELYALDNVILSPHLMFYTVEAMNRLEGETLERCFEVLNNQPVLISSTDPRLRSQTQGVRFN